MCKLAEAKSIFLSNLLIKRHLHYLQHTFMFRLHHLSRFSRSSLGKWGVWGLLSQKSHGQKPKLSYILPHSVLDTDFCSLKYCIDRLHIQKTNSAKCTQILIRWGQSPASLTCMFWHCPRIIMCWQNIFQSLSNILGWPVDPNPWTALCGINGSDFVLTSLQHNIFVSFSTQTDIIELEANMGC